MPQLSVNIDHVATVRQARRGEEPDPVAGAVLALLGGADGITVHLREDRRHIQDDDVRRLRTLAGVRLNFEMAATEEMVAIAAAIRPETAMLVPEGRMEVTTEGGLDVAGQRDRLTDVVARLRSAGMQVSAFIDAEDEQIDAAAACGFAICEIHTGPYAHAFVEHGRTTASAPVQAELERVRRALERVAGLGMRANAGHALNYANVRAIARLSVPLYELHIGHSIVSRAVMVGMERAVREMKALVE